ncbi:unnamed protein product, partial [Urochloa humidicola]
ANDWLRGHLASLTNLLASLHGLPRRSILQRRLAAAARLSRLACRLRFLFPVPSQQHTSLCPWLFFRSGWASWPRLILGPAPEGPPCPAVPSPAPEEDPRGPFTVAGDPPTVVSAPGRRIVAIGDCHGDLSQTRAALVLAGVLSAESDGHLWKGGRTVLVQVGDILDRGEDEIAILSLLSSLNAQAKSQGGAVFQV